MNGLCVYVGSCPVLYTPVGGFYEMESDIYPSGKLGLRISSGFRKPYPHDNYLLRHTPDTAEGLVELRMVEERNETNYLDAVKLYAVDTPVDKDVVSEILSVLPADNIPPEQLLHTVDQNMANPVSMTYVETGQDLSAILAQEDDQYITLNDDNNVFDWKTIEIDLGDVSGAPQIKLVFNARVEFPNTSEGYALARALDPTNLRTRLEVQDTDDSWVVVPQDVAVLTRPKEFYRRHVMDITDIFISSSHKIRLSYLYMTTVDSIHFDVTEDAPVTVTEIPFDSASLHFHGLSNQSDSTPAYVFIYEEPRDPAGNLYNMPGYYTEYGEVTPLVTDIDDMFVIFGTGDEVRIRFADPGPPPVDQSRRFVLYSNGYYKTHKTEIEHTVEPLPFAAMSTFPYDEAVESYPNDIDHLNYLSTWNTRLE
jgi:hypothetical protein